VVTIIKPTSFELVIFDCDGVLVDSEPIANLIFAEMLNNLGFEMTLEDMFRDFMGRSMTTCLQMIRARLAAPLPTGFVEELTQRTGAALSENLRPVDGIESVLDRISIPYCVASSGDHQKMTLTLGLTGLLDRFNGRLFSATEVERGKPHPDVFLYAAERMGADPTRTAVIEDSEVGVRAGVAAGMTVFGYARLSDPLTLIDAGAIAFDSMKQLPELLRLKGPANLLTVHDFGTL
jgi:HAD superfamily hydrolase (TIGR01509 family)